MGVAPARGPRRGLLLRGGPLAVLLLGIPRPRLPDDGRLHHGRARRARLHARALRALARSGGRRGSARARAVARRTRAPRGRRDASRDRRPLLRRDRAPGRRGARPGVRNRLVRAADRGDAGRPLGGARSRAGRRHRRLHGRLRPLHRARRPVRRRANRRPAVRADGDRNSGDRPRLRARAFGRLRESASRGARLPDVAVVAHGRRAVAPRPDRAAAPGRQRRLRETALVPGRADRAPGRARGGPVQGPLRVRRRGHRARRPRDAAARSRHPDPPARRARLRPGPPRRARARVPGRDDAILGRRRPALGGRGDRAGPRSRDASGGSRRSPPRGP